MLVFKQLHEIDYKQDYKKKSIADSYRFKIHYLSALKVLFSIMKLFKKYIEYAITKAFSCFYSVLSIQLA